MFFSLFSPSTFQKPNYAIFGHPRTEFICKKLPAKSLTLELFRRRDEGSCEPNSQAKQFLMLPSAVCLQLIFIL